MESILLATILHFFSDWQLYDPHINLQYSNPFLMAKMLDGPHAPPTAD